MSATLARWVRPSGAAASGSASVDGTGDGVHPLADLPGVDSRAGLAGLMHDERLYRRVLCLFRDRERDFESRFRATLAAGDRGAATRLAHDLKSVAGTLGVHEVEHAAAALEQACRQEAGIEEIEALALKAVSLLDPVIAGLQKLGKVQPP